MGKQTQVGPKVTFTAIIATVLFVIWAGSQDPSASSHIYRMTALEQCQAAARKSARFPATVDYQTMASSINELPGGRTKVRLPFTAKNIFGVEIEHVAWCLFDKSGMIESFINKG
ncbi:MAG: hypothetical protein CMK32_07130 [Porticoccaceae bacterium]|nr:hypothetical protein [Porticoccaceae bacterium]